MKTGNKDGKLLFTTKHIALIAVMAAILIVGKFVLSFVPNIEVVTTFVIVFAFVFGWPALGATLIFCAVDCILYPVSPDVVVSYFIYWNLMAVITILMNKKGIRSSAAYLVLGLVMTLFFGFLTSAVFCLFFGMQFWVHYGAGLIFYALHFVSTLVFMSVGFSPLVKALTAASKNFL